MPDQHPNKDSAKRTLSEISHLFLSDVRDRHTSGAPRPQRIPPGQRPPEPTGDAAAERASSGFAGEHSAEPELAPAPPVTAVIAAHLGGGQRNRVRQYARHLAARLGRIGLIEIDGANLRISCFEPPVDDSDHSPGFDEAAFPESNVGDPRCLAEAIEELNWDVRQWLLAPANLRSPAARNLLGDISHWTLLSTCDHDGVVSSYRTIKGLCDAVRERRPLLTLSLLDAGGQPELSRVFAKLSGVCQQFLNWHVEPEPAVAPAPGVAENPVLAFHSGEPDGPQPWSALADLVARANSAEAEPVAPGNDLETESAAPVAQASRLCSAGDRDKDTAAAPSPRKSSSINSDPVPTANMHMAANEDWSTPESNSAPIRDDDPSRSSRPRRIAPAPTFTPISEIVSEATDHSARAATTPLNPPPIPSMPEHSVAAAQEYAVNHSPGPVPQPAAAMSGGTRPPEPLFPGQAASLAGSSEVLEISTEGTAESILAAILSRPESGLVECPVRTPMCPSARLTIDRNRRVALLAVAREGLMGLRSIGQAYRWLIENRALIGMAVPQLAIDAHQFPRLHLLVDRADASADALQPMLQTGHVTVQAYRRVRWGDRSGLLLDAA